MQEEIEHKTITLMVNGGKMTGRTLAKAMSKFLNHINQKHKIKAQGKSEPAKEKKEEKKEVHHRGKQSVKQLMGQNYKVNSFEIKDASIKPFERIARKYGVDFAIRKMPGDKPRYAVFFRAKDADTIKSAMSEYVDKRVKKDKEKRPSIRKQLRRLNRKTERKDPERNRKQERSR